MLGLVAEGRTNAGVAGGVLWLTEKTVETHVSSILGKLGLSHSAEGHRRVLAVLAYLRAFDRLSDGRAEGRQLEGDQLPDAVVAHDRRRAQALDQRAGDLRADRRDEAEPVRREPRRQDRNLDDQQRGARAASRSARSSRGRS